MQKNDTNPDRTKTLRKRIETITDSFENPGKYASPAGPAEIYDTLLEILDLLRNRKLVSNPKDPIKPEDLENIPTIKKKHEKFYSSSNKTIRKYPEPIIKVKAKISKENINATEKILTDNGIDLDEAATILQAVGYALLDTELYP